MDNKLSMNQQCNLMAKTNSIQGCLNVASALREMILPLSSALVRTHMECWFFFWVPQYKRDRDMVRDMERI